MTKFRGLRDDVAFGNVRIFVILQNREYSGIYTSSASALMGHDRITLNHDHGNLLIDRRT